MGTELLLEEWKVLEFTVAVVARVCEYDILHGSVVRYVNYTSKELLTAKTSTEEMLPTIKSTPRPRPQ